MRRISVWMAVLMILFIVITDMLGIEPDRIKIENASKAAEKEYAATEGRIAEVTYVDDGFFKMLLDSKEYGKILYNVYCKEKVDIYSFPGKTAVAEGRIKLPESASNPGVFDYRRHLRTEDIYLVGECDFENVSVGRLDENPLKGILINKVSEMKNIYFNKMENVWAGAAGLFSGMLFGDSSRMSEEVYESFRKNGTAHILSVSGLHVGIIYAAINIIMGKRRKSLAAACLSCASLAGCALLASFSVSVMRSVVMIFIHILAEKIYKRYDLISAACITAVIFLIFRPYMLFNSGFILSFSAVISLAVIGGSLNRRIRKKGTAVKIMIPIISIQLGMLPISICMFNYFSFAAFISNIPVIFLSSVMIPLGMAGFLLSMLPDSLCILFNVVSASCGMLGEMLIFFNDFTGAYGRLCFFTESPSVFLCAAYYLLIFLMFSEHSYLHPLNKKTFFVVVIILLIIFTAGNTAEKMKSNVVFVDVGQGDCIHIRTPSGKNYLVDGGGSLFSDYDVGEKQLLPYLLKNGVGCLDGIFISHMDADHYKGLVFLNKSIDTGKVYLYEGYKDSEEETASRLNINKEEIRYVRKGTVIHLDKDVSISVIFPEEVKPIRLETKGESDEFLTEEANLNELSAVMMLNYKGTKILLTGDIGAEEERSIKNKCRCDIVKVPHHGSKYSSSEEFVAGSGASAAVVQVGKNNFGHPDETIIERYRKNGIMVFRNDRDGAVLVDIYPEGFAMKGFKGGKKYEF